jgi:iduronate 2-sulfatase
MDKRYPYLLSTILLAPFITAAASIELSSPEEKKMNILFISIDDLRPHIGCYGYPNIKTPHMDRVAANGLLFERAYCQQAVCSPSRTSLLTGLYPDVTEVTRIGPHFRETLPDIVTLPQHFMQNGYLSRGFGKVYHGSGLDDPQSWSVPLDLGNTRRHSPEGQAIKQEHGKGPAFEWYECEDNYFRDGSFAERAIKALETLKDTTFFLAVGFVNPHLPFVSPKRYWDLYKPEDIIIPSNQFHPKDAPSWAVDPSGLGNYYGVPNPLTEEYKHDLIHGYLAATSYIDAQIGLLLQALEDHNLSDNTIVIIWGDHGFQLGEHNSWATKLTNYEISTRSLLIISVPGMLAKGQRTNSLTGFIDVYPSLVDICGLDIPSHCQGKSFKELLDNPDKVINEEAYSQYHRGGYQGYSLRTDRYRFVEWTRNNQKVYELYDHENDPDENTNIAGDPKNKSIIDELSLKINHRKQEDIQKKNELLTGTRRWKVPNDFFIYPNPASDYITLKTKMDISGRHYYQLFDSGGSLLVKEFITKDEMIINVKNLAYGLYLLKVEKEDGAHEVISFLRK